MAKFYVMRLEQGKTVYENVPIQLRPQVNKLLKDKGLEHLIGGD